MKTLKEWRIEAFPDGLSSEMNRGIELAWQACAAEYQPQLESMTHAAHKFSDMWRESQENRRELAAIIDEARKALEASVLALDDWLNLYAPEFCDEARVLEAKKRVNQVGTLSYIATIQAKNRAVLDRSGARGGASRNEPERLVDNSSFTKDRSRTEWLRLQGRKI